MDPSAFQCVSIFSYRNAYHGKKFSEIIFDNLRLAINHYAVWKLVYITKFFNIINFAMDTVWNNYQLFYAHLKVSGWYAQETRNQRFRIFCVWHRSALGIMTNIEMWRGLVKPVLSSNSKHTTFVVENSNYKNFFLKY